ncbi:hypothetical protein AX16_010756 [Volvariella volvacea WC 439]|nr:hypothetical protein AX16_010756 [Volvariella volvacea WC 439]
MALPKDTKTSCKNATYPPCSVTTLAQGKTCSIPVDAVLISSDGLRFGVHSVILSLYSSNLLSSASTGGDVASTGTADSEVSDEIILPENSEELNLLLAFMHPGPLPNIRTGKVTLKVVVKVAEAAEKYGIYSAVEACKWTMEARGKEDPFLVISYAASHGHTDLCDVVAPLTVFRSMEETHSSIKSDKAFRAWVRNALFLRAHN